MPIPIRYRVQEWFADRLSWVQYPQLRPKTVSLGRRQKMTVGEAFDELCNGLLLMMLAIFGLFIVTVGLVLSGILLWAVFTTII